MRFFFEEHLKKTSWIPSKSRHNGQMNQLLERYIVQITYMAPLDEKASGSVELQAWVKEE